MPTSTHIVCPSCDGVNRVPSDRTAADAKCGRCKQPLFNGRPIPLNSTRFATHIGRSDVPVLVDFWASWCGPCRQMAPEFEKAAASLEPGMRLVKVDTESAPDIAAQYNIRSVPTLVMFKGGREAARFSGAVSARELIAWAASR